MSHIAIWTMLSNVGCFIAAGFWGKRVDGARFSARSVAWFCAQVICLSPVIYLSADPEVIRWIAPGEYVLNGLAWSGYNLAMSALLMRAAPGGKSALYFSLYTAGCGVCAAAGATLGAKLAVWLEPLGGFRALWVLGSVTRFLVLWTLGRSLFRKKSLSLPDRPPIDPPEADYRNLPEGSSLGVSP